MILLALGGAVHGLELQRLRVSSPLLPLLSALPFLHGQDQQDEAINGLVTGTRQPIPSPGLTSKRGDSPSLLLLQLECSFFAKIGILAFADPDGEAVDLLLEEGWTSIAIALTAAL
jgi:hypothetical protein